MIKAVTYYQVWCDEPGCGRGTDDGDGEYAAWGSEVDALVEWADWRQGTVVDGRHLCAVHSARCPDHDTRLDNKGQCEDCEGEQPRLHRIAGSG